MEITTSQRVWLGLLAVGLSALAYDKLRSPSVPPGVSTDTIAVAEPALLSPPTPKLSAGAEGVSLKSALARLARQSDELANVRDAFTLPNNWATAPGQTAKGRPRSEAFERNNRLRAILRSGQSRQALVNSRLLSVGQEIDGFVLVDVGEANARFRLADENVTLRIESVSGAWSD